MENELREKMEQIIIDASTYMYDHFDYQSGKDVPMVEINKEDAINAMEQAHHLGKQESEAQVTEKINKLITLQERSAVRYKQSTVQ